MLPGKASDAERSLSRRLIRIWTTFAKDGWYGVVTSKAVTTRNTSERCLLGPTHASSGCVLNAVHLNTLSAHLCPISVANHPLSYRRVPANEARPRMLMIVGLDHTFHYSSGVKNTLLLQTIFLHELTTISRVRDASRPGCLPFNENLLNTIRLLAYPFLLYLVSAATHTLWYCGVPANEAHQRMLMIIGLDHTLHYSSGVKNALLLNSVFLHELTTIARVRGASRPICYPFNENMLSAIGLFAHTSLLYLVNAPIHHLCEPKVQASEDRQQLRLSTGLSHMRQYLVGRPMPIMMSRLTWLLRDFRCLRIKGLLAMVDQPHFPLSMTITGTFSTTGVIRKYDENEKNVYFIL
ncbi:hypothetical protein HPB51_016302 [Rhipicephalus microplus]|uniref:Uncharacterized protein n=1 Tax=Rhipicephalus microplus TaxID=6941 RepID=A0A9J6DAH9_RHIMP|nr:hypothetical protein HPB51_016302 [Rhipicephalus microplus]